MGIRHGQSIGRALMAGALVVMMAGPALALGPNLLSNGDFARGTKEKTEEAVGWHWRLTGVNAIPEYRNPEEKEGRTGDYKFKDGCGEFWPGGVEPWTHLYCPHCGHMVGGLGLSGDYYFDNHKFVELAEGRTGRGVKMTADATKGATEGVRLLSELVDVEPGKAYHVRFDLRRQGPGEFRMFAEGLRPNPDNEEAKQWLEKLPKRSNPEGHKARLKRVYRKPKTVEGTGDWATVKVTFEAPDKKRYQFNKLMINFFLNIPSEDIKRPAKAWIDNVELRQLSPSDYRRWKRHQRRQ